MSIFFNRTSFIVNFNNETTKPIYKVSLDIFYIPIHVPNGIVNLKPFSFGAFFRFIKMGNVLCIPTRAR